MHHSLQHSSGSARIGTSASPLGSAAAQVCRDFYKYAGRMQRCIELQPLTNRFTLHCDKTCRTRRLASCSNATAQPVYMLAAKPLPESSKPKSTRGPTVTKLAQRLSKILALLHQGDDIDKRWLAEKYKVSVRTIERDLSDRLHGIVEHTADGRWQLVPHQRSTIPARHLHDYTRMAGTAQLFPDRSLPYLLEQLDTPEPRRATHVQPTPHEDLRAQGPAFAQLQTAVEQHRECHFAYKGTPRHTQPYRLIHKNGVWYLAAEEAGRLKNFSVALIEALQVDETSRFAPKAKHLDYINTTDDVWFTESTTEVLLRVAPEAAHYFARRQLLPQQQHRADADGSLLVTTHINHVNQLLPVVRFWLPNVRIVKPVEWHAALVEGLRQAMAKWGD